MSEPGIRTRFPLLNIARGLKLVALLCFLLPWITVSCADQTLVSMSGYDLAAGSVTVHNPMTGEVRHPPDAEHPEWPVLIAAALIAAALALSFLLARAQAALAAIGALAATSILDTPYMVNVLPASLMANNQAKSFKEASRYLPLIGFQEQQGSEVLRPQTRGMQGANMQNSRMDGMGIVITGGNVDLDHLPWQA